MLDETRKKINNILKNIQKILDESLNLIAKISSDTKSVQDLKNEIGLFFETCKQYESTPEILGSDYYIKNLKKFRHLIKDQWGKGNSFVKACAKNLKKPLKELSTILINFNDDDTVNEKDPVNLSIEKERFDEQKNLNANPIFNALLLDINKFRLKKIFSSKTLSISHAWTDPADTLNEESAEESVLLLQQHLTATGFVVLVDRIHSGAGQELVKFMRDFIEKADHILVICNRNMNKKFNKGFTGVCIEYLNYIPKYKENPKQHKRFIVPVCMTEDPDDVPGLTKQFAEVSIYKQGYFNALLDIIKYLNNFGQDFEVFLANNENYLALKKIFPGYTQKFIKLPPKSTVKKFDDKNLKLFHDDNNNNHNYIQTTNKNDQRKNTTWNPPPRYENFVGRKEILKKILNQLNAVNPNPLAFSILTLSGLSGMGKTHIMIELFHRLYALQKFDLMAWLNAESIQSLTQDYYQLGKFLGLIDEKTPIQEAIKIIKNSFQNRDNFRCLFALDNAENYSLIKEFIPPGVTVVVTSRNSTSWPKSPIEIDSMSKEESMALIAIITGLDNEKNEIEELIRILAQAPLPMAHAASYIEQNQISVKEFIIRFKNETIALLSDTEFVPKDYTYLEDRKFIPVYRTWHLSAEKIKARNENAFNILITLAYFDAIKVPETLLLQFISLGNYALDVALNTLKQFSMIKRENGFVSIHRLVQQVIRLWVRHKEAIIEKNARYFLGSLSAAINQEYFITTISSDLPVSPQEQRQRQKNLVIHLLKFSENILQEYGKTDKDDKNLTKILQDLTKIAIHLQYTLPDIVAAFTIQERILTIQEKLCQADPSMLGNTWLCLAEAFKDAGYEERAIPYYDKVIQLNTKLKNEVYLIRLKTFKAAAHRGLGKFYESITVFKAALEYYHQTLEYYCTYWVSIHLADTLCLIEEYEQAYQHYEKAIEICETKYNSNNLKAVYIKWPLLRFSMMLCKHPEKKEDIQRAIDYFNIVENEYLKEFNDKHYPLLAFCYLYRGKAYCQLKNFATAEKDFLIAKEIYEKYTPDTKPYSSLALLHLYIAQAYQDKGADEKTVNKYCNEALNFCNLGANKHPEWIAIFEELGDMYSSFAESNACHCYEEALKIIEYIASSEPTIFPPDQRIFKTDHGFSISSLEININNNNNAQPTHISSPITNNEYNLNALEMVSKYKVKIIKRLNDKLTDATKRLKSKTDRLSGFNSNFQHTFLPPPKSSSLTNNASEQSSEKKQTPSANKSVANSS